MRHKRKFIKAIDMLIEGYKEDRLLTSCPLCKICINPVYIDCTLCPWFIFEGTGCITLSYTREPLPKRIIRLKEWRKKIVLMDRRLKCM